MNLPRLLIWVLAISIVLVPPSYAARRYVAAQREHEAAMRAFRIAEQDAREVLALRANRQQIETRQRPQEHVLAQVNAALAHAGVPSRRFQGLRPDTDVLLPGTELRRQSMTVSFQNTTLPELGAFLAAWREQQALWTPTRIELTKTRGRPGATGAADDEHYDVTLIISAVYLAGD